MALVEQNAHLQAVHGSSKSQLSKKMLAEWPPGSRGGDDAIGGGEGDLAAYFGGAGEGQLAEAGVYTHDWTDLLPEPVMALNTPAGMTSLTTLASSRTDREVSLEGFRTVQQPLARTVASFQAAIRKGKFQGMIWPTTPMGSWTIMDRVVLSRKLHLSSSAMMEPAK